MKAVIAIDSFKGSLTTFESGAATKEAIKAVYPDSEVVISPLADGGEGTVRAIIGALDGEICHINVKGPRLKPTNAEYGIIKDRKTAVIEISEAAGITLVTPEEKNPLYTTTYGVGEIIFDAIKRGIRRFIIGLGGSATNDGGVGMLMALGFEFLDENLEAVPHGAIGLSRLKYIKAENALPELRECEFNIACDVQNPLCGENGASAVYGPQKGADSKTVSDMDTWMRGYAELTKEYLGTDLSSTPGVGAAGGLGFAFVSYLGARLCSGIELVMRETGLEEHIKDADIVVTGEGRLDGQSCMGKAPVGVARIAKKYGKTVIAFSGAATDDAPLTNEYGIDAFFPILRAPQALEEAMDKDNAYKNLRMTAEQVFRLMRALRFKQ